MFHQPLDWRVAAESVHALLGTPQVTILMAVHEGAAHLGAQLDSFAAQQHENWRVVASLDGAGDGSREVLERHPEAHRIQCIDGPRRGAAANFMHLMRCVTPAGYWAFSDQDDVWLPRKLSRAIEHLSALPADVPALYHSRSWVTDEELGDRRLSPPRRRPPGFANALVQNIAGGNTIVLNPAAAELAHQAAQEAGWVVMHDWWLYQIVTGCGGIVVHDDAPGLLYRQHRGNVIGANRGLRAKARRLRMVLDGSYKRWMETNLAALSASAHRFTPENRALLRRMGDARPALLRDRIRMLRDLGLYRQSRAAQALMWFSVVINRF